MLAEKPSRDDREYALVAQLATRLDDTETRNKGLMPESSQTAPSSGSGVRSAPDPAVKPPLLRAFVVLVNQYVRVQDLSFCAAAAHALVELLRKRFQVAQSHVVTLHDLGDQTLRPTMKNTVSRFGGIRE